MKKPVVALVGRPNVGKSTLFNCLVGKKISIIEDTPGVTRDRVYGNVEFENYKFHLIDTGGVDISKEVFNDEIKVQVELAIDEADTIVFVVDGREDLTLNDLKIRDYLLKSTKKVIVAINKIDDKNYIFDMKKNTNLWAKRFYEIYLDNNDQKIKIKWRSS